MKGLGLFLACLMFLSMVGCGDPKPPSRDTSSYDDRGTVYDDGGGAVDEVEDVMEEPNYYGEGGGITSRNLDDDDNMEEMNQSLDLNWPPIFFEFDQAELSASSKSTLKTYADILVRNPKLLVLLEGHCDRRGTEDYNLALGERRAQNVSVYLQQLGVPANRLRTISYGELRPLDGSENEGAWAKNRRVSFTF